MKIVDAKQKSSLKSDRVATVVACEEAELVEHVDGWRRLCEQAAEPNVFYEPWALLPAVAELRDQEQLLFVLVYDGEPKVSDLIGFFVLDQKRVSRLPVKMVTMWQHLHCYLCTPLLHHKHVSSSLDAFFNWVEQHRGGMVRFPMASADGPFEHALRERINRCRMLDFLADCQTRAILKPRRDADGYLRQSMSTSYRKQMRKLRKRLDELGKVECIELDDGDDVDAWLEQFLRLEASSWKGQAGTAIAMNKSERCFVVQMCKGAFELGKLHMLALVLNGQPIASQINFRTQGVWFAYKVAYDEHFAKYSPGIQLEIESIRAVHRRSDIEFVDSCAVPDHPIARLWSERRIVQDIYISAGTTADLLVSGMPLARYLKRLVRRI